MIPNQVFCILNGGVVTKMNTHEKSLSCTDMGTSQHTYHTAIKN